MSGGCRFLMVGSALVVGAPAVALAQPDVPTAAFPEVAPELGPPQKGPVQTQPAQSPPAQTVSPTVATPMPDSPPAPTPKANDPERGDSPAPNPRQSGEDNSRTVQVRHSTTSTGGDGRIASTGSIATRADVGSPVGAESRSAEESSTREDAARSKWSIEAGTRVPVNLGLQSRFQTPYWLRLSAGVGLAPGAYLGVINGALRSAHLNGGLSSKEVTSSFDSGFDYNARLGFLPSRSAGIYLEMGYARLNFTGRFRVADVGGAAIPSELETEAVETQTGMDLAMFELGWERNLGARLIVGVGLGLMVTLNAETDLVGSAPARETYEASREAARRLDDGLERYGYLPSLAVRFGYELL